jgi:hypothetical protein
VAFPPVSRSRSQQSARFRSWHQSSSALSLRGVNRADGLEPRPQHFRSNSKARVRHADSAGLVQGLSAFFGTRRQPARRTQPAHPPPEDEMCRRTWGPDSTGLPHSSEPAIRQTSTVSHLFWDHTLCSLVNDLRVCERLVRQHFCHTRGDLGKCVTAIYWGSSGRRFKSCQPDAGRRLFPPCNSGLTGAVPKRPPTPDHMVMP